MNTRSNWLAVLVSALSLLITAVYLVAYLRLPNEGAIVDVTRSLLEPGLPLRVLRQTPGGLQTDDRVLALDGVGLDSVLQAAARRPLRSPPVDSALSVTVLRGDQSVTVRQPLGPAPFGALLRQYWASLLFLYYMQALSILVFVRRPDLAAARVLFVASSALVATGTIYYFGLPLNGLRYGWLLGFWLAGIVLVYGAMLSGLLHFALLFPRPWPALRRPLVLALVYGAPWLLFGLSMAAGWQPAAGWAPKLALAVQSTSGISAIMTPPIILSSLLVLRRARTLVERRQLRWLVWSFLVAIVPWLLLVTLPQMFGRGALLSPLVIGLLWLTIPTAFAISILREGLFDIDIIINRTLVYGALTVVLAGAYFAGVVGLQTVFRAVSGAGQSELATVLSTLSIAALFSPVRGRMQIFIDLRFFRRKYDAARTLASFAGTLRDEVELGQLSERLVQVVADTMQPEHLSLWLRPAAGESPAQGLPLRLATPGRKAGH